MRLHVFPDTLLISPNRGQVGASLRIDRHTGSYSRINVSEHTLDLSQAASQFIYGVVGVQTLLRGSYLLVITESERVGIVAGCEIRRIQNIQFFPFSPNKLGRDLRTSALREDESSYLQLLDQALRESNFYFTPPEATGTGLFQLTHTLQRAHSLVADGWRSADERFFWNRKLSDPLIAAEMDEWVTPIMSGFVYVHRFTLNRHSVVYGLVSRRSCQRAGKRYTVRGLDTGGHAANFVETEQFVMVQKPKATEPTSEMEVASHVQTRGSMPFLWAQPVCVRYSPKPVIVKGDASAQPFNKHVADQIQRYGKQVMVSLVDDKGSQLKLNTVFRELVEDPNKVRFVGWDFHHECRKMQYQNIHKLVALFREDLDHSAYFHCRVSADGKATVVVRQSGVVRTNCMDCLDRTNVVQSVIARYALHTQLNAMGVLRKMEPEKEFRQDTFERAFKNVWADNADAMSLPYSGTGAQKTDYTRTGKRSLAGSMRDLSFSVIRYYKNNFCDGQAQDGLDLMLGKHVPVTPPSLEAQTQYKSPFVLAKDSKSIVRFSMKVCALSLLLLLLVRFVASLVFHASLPSLIVTAILYVLVIPAVCFVLAQRNGERYVDKPRLGRQREHEKWKQLASGLSAGESTEHQDGDHKKQS